MIKNLHTADLLVKLTLAVLTIMFYFFDVISGPFAAVLTGLSLAILLIYAIKALNPVIDRTR
jgi:hypothetical protein